MENDKKLTSLCECSFLVPSLSFFFSPQVDLGQGKGVKGEMG